MADYTPRLGLRKDEYPDYSNILAMHENWDKLDAFKQEHDDHSHDNSDIWAAIEELWRFVIGLDNRVTYQENFVTNFYEEFLRHNHDGVSTLWNEFFTSYTQMLVSSSTARVTPDAGLMHLPQNYTKNEVYRWVGKPFDLTPDLYPDKLARITSPESLATRGYAKIIRARKGNVVPYLTVSDDIANLPQGADRQGFYQNAKRGELLSQTPVTRRYPTQFSFADRARGRAVHEGFHFIGRELATVNPYDPDYKKNIPFTNGEYARLVFKDGQSVTTQQGRSVRQSEISYEEVQESVNPRVLYGVGPSGRSLAYDAPTNTFYWYTADRGTFARIDAQRLPGIFDGTNVEVAATPVPGEDAAVYVFVTRARDERTPEGYFNVTHQLMKWSGNLDEEPEMGIQWTGAQMMKRHWPRPRVLAPKHLEVVGSKLYLVTPLDPSERLVDGQSRVNYYDAAPDYSFFPARILYGDIFRGKDTVDFALFDPAILGTVAHINLDGRWTVEAAARRIGGNYRPNNRWRMLEGGEITTFEGANDQVYAGRVDDDLIFYQTFCPYDGERVYREGLYKGTSPAGSETDKEAYRAKMTGTEFYGIVRFGLESGDTNRVSTKMPMRINVGSGVLDTDAYIVGGLELVKQYVTSDGKTLATADDSTPSGVSVAWSFWMNRDAPGAKTQSASSGRQRTVDPIRLNVFNGSFERISTASDPSQTVDAVQHPQIVVDGNGYSIVGGRQIRGSSQIRVTPTAPVKRKVGLWSRGLIDGARAQQIYRFKVTTGTPAGALADELRIFYDGRVEGFRDYNDPANLPEKDYTVYLWTFPGWRPIKSAVFEDSPAIIRDPSVLTRGEIVLLVANRARTHRQRKIESKIHTDHIHVELIREGHVYEYKWEDMPKGGQAALVLESTSSVDDVRGVEVSGVQLDVVSSKGVEE